jgi:hypothetical protein
LACAECDDSLRVAQILKIHETIHNYTKADSDENFFHLIPLLTLIICHAYLTFRNQGEKLTLSAKVQ